MAKRVKSFLYSFLQIFRVQNPTTYEHYMVSLETVADNRGRSQSEIELAPVYHGTSQESVKPIVESNNKSFERGFSSANSESRKYFMSKANDRQKDVCILFITPLFIFWCERLNKAPGAGTFVLSRVALILFL